MYQNLATTAMTVVCTVLLSVIFRGITANPWAKSPGARTGITPAPTLAESVRRTVR